jgi:hypothetical protein|tara:strand:+ start:625 stop:738 length:114 start_codon:yes stop_codon:yes gene_type:complete
MKFLKLKKHYLMFLVHKHKEVFLLHLQPPQLLDNLEL